MKRIDRWEDSCRVWSAEGARHEVMAREAVAKNQAVTAAEAFVRASIYYHYGKHLFADHAEEFRAAHEAMLRCYSAGAARLDPPLERVEFLTKGVFMPGWLRKPRGSAKPPVAVICRASMPARKNCTPGLKPSSSRGMAALTLDGPGQGETSFHLPTTSEWGPVLGAVIDVLEKRNDVDGSRVG